MFMTRRAQELMRPAVDAAPRVDAARSDIPALTSGGFTALLKSAAQEILAVTHWFDPVPHSGPYPVTIRFSRHRVVVKGRMPPGGRVVPDETIDGGVPWGGPIPLTAPAPRRRPPGSAPAPPPPRRPPPP